MNYWVSTAGRYRATSFLAVHAAFFNHHQFDAMIYMLGEIVWARMMTALNLESIKAMHYHGEGYESDNDYGLPAQVGRHVCTYIVSTTESSFNLANYKEAQHTISPLCPDDPETCPFVKRPTGA